MSTMNMSEYSVYYYKKLPEYAIAKQILTGNKTMRDRRTDGKSPMAVIRAVIVHYVGNPGSTALENRNYFNSIEEVSAHYIVGLKGEVIQAVPDEKTAFHAGYKKYTELADAEFMQNGVRMHNDWTIGVESCHLDFQGNYAAKTYTTFVRLVADLLNQYKLDEATGLWRHYDLTTKECPVLFIKNAERWNLFKCDVALARERK
jgi:N-acetylmuramoyl-L-alanine amidase